MPVNAAPWLDAAHVDLTVRPAPYTPPGEHEIVIHTAHSPSTPSTSSRSRLGNLIYRWLPYPSVLGEDVAGEVVEVGNLVTRFRVGDRVRAYAVGIEKGRRHESEGGFQTYTVPP